MRINFIVGRIVAGAARRTYASIAAMDGLRLYP